MVARAPCCQTRQEAIDRTLVPIIKYLLGSCWEVAALRRWTQANNLMARTLVGMLCKQLLPKALSEVKVFWGMPESESIERFPEKLADADAQVWSVKSKNKLLRAGVVQAGRH